jgi:hypothetical protein
LCLSVAKGFYIGNATYRDEIKQYCQ